ncbi:SPW repeat domain-containing protein [Glutamicibacter sp. 287]|uniref:SPW repeat domain-containing protein n=1 Tax=unclassified Glutamicibacter TaxID=2627139 RepID=UPI004034EF96
MKKWTRWQDWVVVVAGAYAALSTTWVTGTTMSMNLMVGLGALMVVVGIWSVAMPRLVSLEWVLAAVSALMVVAPWLGSYASSYATASWVSWICGAVGLVASLWAIAPAMHMRHETHGGTRAAH